MDECDWLVAKGVCTPAALLQARALSGENGDRIPRALSKLGFVSEGRLAKALAEEFGLELAGTAEAVPDPSLSHPFTTSFLRARWVAPVRREADCLVVAVADPTDDDLQRSLEFGAGTAVRRIVTTYSAIEAMLLEARRSVEEAEGDLASDDPIEDEALDALRDLASDAPVVRRVQRLISDAIDVRASDIHFEPLETGLQVRYRVDGVLKDVDLAPRTMRNAIVSRLKIMAGLNIAERRLPQDGRIRVTVHGRDTDFRVATAPTIFGESVVLRILDREQVALDFDALGFDADVTARLRHTLSQPYGILLCTGPTGSGKTTTLYAALKELNTVDRKILTVEDPVEYTLPGINQTHVKPAIGYTFANALRAFLRQDPDILMVGEIRDRETAEIAVQAALTGHLLLSTLHTNTAAAAITRLLDMGIDDYLLTSTLSLVIGQRLVRRLCPTCRVEHAVPPEMWSRLGLSTAPDAPIYRAQGCIECNSSGYIGRTSILELFALTPPLQRMVLQKADARMLEEAAVGEGMRTMVRHGLEKVCSGETTLEEVLRVTRVA